MQLAEVMTTELLRVRPETSVGDAAALMDLHNRGSVLVLLDERLLGIFTERDVVRAVSHAADASSHSVQDWMSADPVTIDGSASLGQALDLMLDRGFRHLPVTQGGGLAGIVSMRDLSRISAAKPART